MAKAESVSLLWLTLLEALTLALSGGVRKGGEGSSLGCGSGLFRFGIKIKDALEELDGGINGVGGRVLRLVEGDVIVKELEPIKELDLEVLPKGLV